MRTPEEFKVQAEKYKITHWDNHDCAMCGYMTKYIFNYGKVFFDCGCNCTGQPNNVSQRTWDEVADHYNKQSNANVKKEFAAFWHFDD